MPHYFIDVQDGEHFYHDDVGEWTPSLEHVRANVAEMLLEVARGRLRDNERREFVIAVRDESGSALYRASLTFQAEWLVSHAMPPTR